MERVLKKECKVANSNPNQEKSKYTAPNQYKATLFLRERAVETFLNRQATVENYIFIKKINFLFLAVGFLYSFRLL